MSIFALKALLYACLGEFVCGVFKGYLGVS